MCCHELRNTQFTLSGVGVGVGESTQRLGDKLSSDQVKGALAEQVWEVAAYNRVIDLERQGPLLAVGLCAAVLTVRFLRWRRRRRVKRVPSGDKDANV